MNKVIGTGLLVTAVALLFAACGPSESDCNELCDWAAKVCDDRESCMDDCRDAWKDDVNYALDNCLDRAVSTCKSANCCLRFTYEEYYFEQNCL
jgi:hypothetical protein